MTDSADWADRGSGSGGGWLLSALLVLNLFLLLSVLSFANATAEGPARRALGRGIAVLTEVDAYLDGNLDALREEAAEGQEVTAPGFPVEVSFSADEAANAEPEELRALLLTRAAETIYRDGMSAFGENPATDVDLFSRQGVIRRGMNLLGEKQHTASILGVAVLAVTAAVLTLALGLTRGPREGLTTVGRSVLLAAVPFLLLSVLLQLAFRGAADADDSYLTTEFATLGRDLAWAPIRNSLIFVAGGAILFAWGAALSRWRRSGPRDPSFASPRS